LGVEESRKFYAIATGRESDQWTGGPRFIGKTAGGVKKILKQSRNEAAARKVGYSPGSIVANTGGIA